MILAVSATNKNLSEPRLAIEQSEEKSKLRSSFPDSLLEVMVRILVKIKLKALFIAYLPLSKMKLTLLCKERIHWNF